MFIMRMLIPAYIIGCILALIIWNGMKREIDKDPARAAGKRRRTVNMWLWNIFFVAMSSLSLLCLALPQGTLERRVKAVANVWLDVQIYAGLLSLLPVIAWGANWLFHYADEKRFRKMLSVFAILIPVGTAALIAEGTWSCYHTVVTKVEAECAKSAGDLRSMKVVVLADLHLNTNTSPEQMENVVRLVNAEDPDLVIVAGDIFTSSYAELKNPERYEQIFSQMTAKYGVYATWGNHDNEEVLFCGFPQSPIKECFRPDTMYDFVRKCGFTLLEDESVEIADGQVTLIGCMDNQKKGDGTSDDLSPAELMEGIDVSKPVIVAQHEPEELEEWSSLGADLFVSGHTHAGQTWPGSMFTEIFNEANYGPGQIGDLTYYTTSGVGFFGPPMRVGTKSEIAVIEWNFR